MSLLIDYLFGNGIRYMLPTGATRSGTASDKVTVNMINNYTKKDDLQATARV